MSRIFVLDDRSKYSSDMPEIFSEERVTPGDTKALPFHFNLYHQEKMQKPEITEEMILDCFATAIPGEDSRQTAESFVDVELYENQVMYPEFARWAEKAGYPELASLFRKVAGEEKLHAIWLKELYSDIATPVHGKNIERAIAALLAIQANCDALIKINPDGVIEKALKVAITVEQREALDIYPEFRDRELKNGNQAAADIYQRVVDSESQHMYWFQSALDELTALRSQTVPT